MKTILVANAMGLALAQAALKAQDGDVKKHVVEAIQKDGVGMHKEQGWNAHLKHRTYQDLKARGYMA